MRNPKYGRGIPIDKKNESGKRNLDKYLPHLLCTEHGLLVLFILIFIKGVKNLERNW